MSKLTEAMDEEFKFKIGDAVTTKNVLDQLRAEGEVNGNTRERYGRLGSVVCFTVVERLAQQCHGGVQRLYVLSGYGRTATEAHYAPVRLQLAEVELVPFAESVEVMKAWAQTA